MQQFVSSDGGTTWPTKYEAVGGDKQWIVADETDGPGSGNLYMVWNPGGTPFFPADFSRSTDGGVTWSIPINVPGNYIAGTLAVDDSGVLWIAGTTGAAFAVARSDDARSGTTTPSFTTEVVTGAGAFLLGAGNSPNPAGLVGQIWIAADRSGAAFDGSLYIVCSLDPQGPDPAQVIFTRKRPGQAWEAPRAINPEPPAASSWQWFGTMDVAPNGRIDMVCNDTSHTLMARMGRTRYIYSTDGGDTWSAPLDLTPTWDSYIGWPNQAKIGDYYQLRSDVLGAHLIYSTTVNGEQDVWYARLGEADCDRDGVSDAAAIVAGAADINGDGLPDGCQCLADINGNDVVDDSDLGILLNGFGKPPTSPAFVPAADINSDGAIQDDDLALLLNDFGAACP